MGVLEWQGRGRIKLSQSLLELAVMLTLGPARQPTGRMSQGSERGELPEAGSGGCDGVPNELPGSGASSRVSPEETLGLPSRLESFRFPLFDFSHHEAFQGDLAAEVELFQGHSQVDIGEWLAHGGVETSPGHQEVATVEAGGKGRSDDFLSGSLDAAESPAHSRQSPGSTRMVGHSCRRHSVSVTALDDDGGDRGDVVLCFELGQRGLHPSLDDLQSAAEDMDEFSPSGFDAQVDPIDFLMGGADEETDLVLQVIRILVLGGVHDENFAVLRAILEDGHQCVFEGRGVVLPWNDY